MPSLLSWSILLCVALAAAGCTAPHSQPDREFLFLLPYVESIELPGSVRVGEPFTVRLRMSAAHNNVAQERQLAEGPVSSPHPGTLWLAPWYTALAQSEWVEEFTVTAAEQGTLTIEYLSTAAASQGGVVVYGVSAPAVSVFSLQNSYGIEIRTETLEVRP